MKLTKSIPFMAIAVLVLASLQTVPPVLAGDELQNEAACQECLNNAEAAWQECVDMAGGDEGDAACAAAKRGSIQNCQQTVCID